MKSKLKEEDKFEEARKSLELGIKFLENDELDKAEKKFKDVSNKFPELVASWIGLGNVYAAKNNTEEAFKNYERALKILPSSELYNNLGTLYFVQGDKVKAETYLKRAVQMDKKNFHAKKNLADCYLANAKYQEAIYLYEEVLIKRVDTDTFISLANCYFKLGIYESAKLGYEQVLKLDPDNKIAKENLKFTKKRHKTRD